MVKKVTIIDVPAIYIKCSSNNKIVYKNAHLFVQPHSKLNKKSTPRTSDDPLSVFIFGLDSVSRINMHRYMNKTLDAIKKFDYIDLKGFNKVQDNTFPNNIVLLTGHLKEEIEWTKPMFFDRVDLIWKDYSKKGFVTAFAEDCTSLALFHTYGIKRGFQKQPTDYYPIRYLRAMEEIIGWKSPLIWISGCRACIGPTPTIDIMLQYATDISQRVQHVPAFSFVWTSSLTHDRHNFAGLSDESFANFLNRGFKENYWNHSIVFLIADHGVRFGRLRKSYIGKIEENLPFGYVLLPNWFKEKYPSAYKNLVINQQRLVTQYDFHQTLLDILHGKYKDETYLTEQYDSNNLNGGLSLFKEIPGTRTCIEALIPVHYCSGIKATPVSKDNQDVVLATKEVVRILNSGLLNFPDCIQFSDFEVNKAYLINLFRNNEEKNLFNNATFLEIQFTTIPGRAVLETVVKIEIIANSFHASSSRKYVVSDTVSRLNSYAGQSDCINDSHYVKYCYCKEALARTKESKPCEDC